MIPTVWLSENGKTVDNKNISDYTLSRGKGEVDRMNRQCKEDIWDCKINLYDTIIDIFQYTFVQTHTLYET